MPLFIVALGVVLLIVLISVFKMNTFVSLLIISFIASLALGVPMEKTVLTIESGIGGTLGHIALIFGLGAMLGKLIADSGGAKRIALTLIHKFGEKRIQWAVVVSSFIVGVAMFFEVGLVLLIPIVFSIEKELKVSPLYLINAPALSSTPYVTPRSSTSPDFEIPSLYIMSNSAVLNGAAILFLTTFILVLLPEILSPSLI